VAMSERIKFDAFARDDFINGFARRKQKRREIGYLNRAHEVIEERQNVRNEQRKLIESRGSITLETKSAKASRRAASTTPDTVYLQDRNKACAVELSEGHIPRWMGGLGNTGTVITNRPYVNALRAMKTEERLKRRELERWRTKAEEEDKQRKLDERELKKNRKLNLFKNNVHEAAPVVSLASLSAGNDLSMSLTMANLAVHNCSKVTTSEYHKMNDKSKIASLIGASLHGKAVSVAVSRAATNLLKEADKQVKSKKLKQARKKTKKRQAKKKRSRK